MAHGHGAAATAPSRWPSCSPAATTCCRRAARQPAGGRLWRRRDVSSAPTRWRWRRSPGASAISRRTTGPCSTPTAPPSTQGQPGSSARSGRAASSGALIGKGNHRHFMLKEIHEQPAVVGDTLRALPRARDPPVELPALPFDFAKVPRLTIVACGTACFAGMVAKYWFERLARLPVEVDIASEFRYREPPLPEAASARDLAVGRDPRYPGGAALRQGQRQTILVVVNVPESAIAREVDVLLPTLAGPEIGVASTKAFTTQLRAAGLRRSPPARARGTLVAGGRGEAGGCADRAAGARSTRCWTTTSATGASPRHPAPRRATCSFSAAALLSDRARRRAQAEGDLLHPRRGLCRRRDEARADRADRRGGAGHRAGALRRDLRQDRLQLPGGEGARRQAGPAERRGGHRAARAARPRRRSRCRTVDPLVAPILYAVPVQLLAYHTAVAKGTDVDQPRNLAKSVTVE